MTYCLGKELLTFQNSVFIFQILKDVLTTSFVDGVKFGNAFIMNILMLGFSNVLRLYRFYAGCLVMIFPKRNNWNEKSSEYGNFSHKLLNKFAKYYL